MVIYSSVLYRLDALNWTIYSFRLPLIPYGFRQGLLVHLGEERWGEISPFPGRSRETLTEAFTQLKQWLTEGKIQGELYPSVQFGLESAHSPPFTASAPLYALLNGDLETMYKQADRAECQGYRIVKLKISHLSIDRAQMIIHRLKHRFRLRIDCNCAFTFNEIMTLLSPFDKNIFDYIEDPTFELPSLSQFPFPFALDETVSLFRSLPLHAYPNFYGFILKPTLLGGTKGCLPYLEYASRHQRKIVFSPTFESGLGLLQILFLAKKLHLTTDPIGLDTARYLKQDLLDPAIDFNVPFLTIQDVPRINKNLLTKVAHGKCAMSDSEKCPPDSRLSGCYHHTKNMDLS